MSDESRRFISPEFKERAVQRMARGENVSALARELGVRRAMLYAWRSRYVQGGVDAFRSQGRPSGSGVRTSWSDELDLLDQEAVRRRIAELERKVGQQQIDLDFFRGALRRIEASRRPGNGPGGTASSPRSKR